ncbi:MAG: DUF2911 domain-containing protein [Opitutaceae bacterium]|nr:DUF2911 domain-containing protein [Opitutaceae bacterium]
MNLTRLSVFCLAVALIGTTSMFSAEKKAKKARVSPPDVATANIDGNEVKIAYSRPFETNPKGGEVRKIWGVLVPYGKVWRAGANEATVLTVDKPIVIGGYNLAAGKYTLFVVPTEGAGSKLIINKKTGQWGIPYKEEEEKANELARVDLKRGKTKSHLPQFTITVDKVGAGSGRITFAWADAQYAIDFKNKS